MGSPRAVGHHGCVTPPTAAPVAGPPAAPRLLGRLLIAEGCASESEVEAALGEQAGTGLRLGELLVRRGAVDGEVVARLLARQLGLPYRAHPLRPEPAAAALVDGGFARARHVLPLRAAGRSVEVAMADPLDLDTVRDLAFRTGRRVEAAVVSAAALARGLDRAYGSEVERLVADMGAQPADDPDADALERAASATPVVRLLDRVLQGAAEAGASDVHLEPVGNQLRVRLRIDGVLRTTHELPPGVRDAVLSRLKILADMDIAVRRRPQDGGFKLAVGRSDRGLSLRVSTLPTGDSEKAVVRILDPHRVPPGLDALGFAERDRRRVEALIAAGRGVILATGPTGSGKSSTLQAALRAVDRERLNVVALEDPVEYRVPGVVHVQMARRAGLTFASALRSVLRQDPDVVMVGEIRDRETAETAMSAAVTGHLVLSTLHTTDAPGAVARLLQMGVPPYLVAAGLSGVIAQRLVRRLCERCAGESCDRCHEGFAGRSGVFQVLVMDDRIRAAVADGAPAGVVRRLAREGGMGTLRDDARRAVAEAVTRESEVDRVLRDDPGAPPPCRGCGGTLPSEARHCPWCGIALARWCSCGASLQEGWQYCPACAGSTLSPPAAPRAGGGRSGRRSRARAPDPTPG